ncbi:DMT family transporter [Bacillaceae bacterium W0354]
MLRSYIFVIIPVIIYAGNLLVGKAINDLPPVTITFFRTIIAFLVVLPFGIKQFREHTDIWKENWKPLFGIGLTGISTFNILVYLSLNFTSSTNAGIVEATTPVFAMFLAFIFLKERLKARQLIGAAISFAGAVWVLTNGALDMLFSLNYNIGDLFMLLAVVVWSIFTLIVNIHNSKFPVYGGLLVMLGFGLTILFPLLFVEWMIVGVPDALADGKMWIGLLYLGIFPSFIALMFWNKSVSQLGSSLASVFLNLLPLFTAIGAVLFLGEKIYISQILGGLLVISGVILVNVDVKKLFRKTKVQKEERSA